MIERHRNRGDVNGSMDEIDAKALKKKVSLVIFRAWLMVMAQD